MRTLLLTLCFGIISIGCVLGAQDVLAAESFEYKPIVGLPLPGNFNPGAMTTGEFVQVLYALSISVAAMLAVVRIIYAGVQYMLTDVVTSKQSAKEDIKGALFGLLIVIGAVLLLRTINPELLSLKMFEDLPVTSVSTGGTNSAVGPTSGANSDNATKCDESGALGTAPDGC